MPQAGQTHVSHSSQNTGSFIQASQKFAKKN